MKLSEFDDFKLIFFLICFKCVFDRVRTGVLLSMVVELVGTIQHRVGKGRITCQTFIKIGCLDMFNGHSCAPF